MDDPKEIEGSSLGAAFNFVAFPGSCPGNCRDSPLYGPDSRWGVVGVT